MRAYRLTLYEAGGVTARHGKRSASANGWMARHGARTCGFITVWNPMSRRHPTLEGWSGYRSWHEHNLLIAADPRLLMRAARRFRQAAILIIPRGQPARLLYR